VNVSQQGKLQNSLRNSWWNTRGQWLKQKTTCLWMWANKASHRTVWEITRETVHSLILCCMQSGRICRWSV